MKKRPLSRRADNRLGSNSVSAKQVDLDGFGGVPIIRRRRGSSIEPIKLRPDFMTIDEAAEYWRCSRRKIERKIKAGDIKKIKDGHRTLLRIRDVRAYAKKWRKINK